MRIRRHPSSPAVSIRELQYQIQTQDSQPQNILEEIVWHKEKEVDRFRDQTPLSDLQQQVAKLSPPQDFLAALRQGKTTPALIAEVKKASPSKGQFRDTFHPEEIAQAYERAGASCLSVLTDQKFFQGGFEILSQVRESVQIPLLCKDFVLYPYQIYKARAHGADAVLLIAAVLSNQDLAYFMKIIKALGMTALVEVHTLEELDRVISIPGVDLVGINNRDLETFHVDLAVTCSLIDARVNPLRDRGILVVSESGIHGPQDVAAVAQAGAQAILVGESLIKQESDESHFASELERMQTKIDRLFNRPAGNL
ncbi:indole-3-glycerol phosphate synthase TrpC [Lyngbya confervoides]|uniref:Indole-3-glycerol phosphate synthase n=1 Tax=Lyngbya confervoides BDU141951 TaxID=1574623 RepID=A0ABD4T2S5_9CYAN|nr:indole-3-glycerol phosphate synthase TrpC [Lyngbya confervoides]MCM1983042.1 indole-3-glycerol phosphate synthase TrpC [Lyngbya confervoides BDU141951]